MFVKKGSVFVYNVFDIGWEIDLKKAEDLLLLRQKESSRFKFSKDPRKAIIIKEAPLSISLGHEKISINNIEYKYSSYAKIWDYGTISITTEIILNENTSIEEIYNLASFLETSNNIEIIARKIKDEIKQYILPSIKLPQEWEQFEDYIIYYFNEIDGLLNPKEIFNKIDIGKLILGEFKEKLSDMAVEPITTNYIQYYENDIAIIDWDSSIIIDPSQSRDTFDAIEFSLTHLLELRYYDYMIDKKLDTLYDAIEKREKGFKKILKFIYQKISEEATRNYIEFSDLRGKIENSFKTVGDPYIATVFRTCAEQFRFYDWDDSISRKMSTLFQITQILQSELNAIRSHLLEIIIIILIAIELIPLISEILSKF